MNDTHPTLCIPELIRILMDVKGLSWKEAREITRRTMAYTNHTVLPEALEKWSLKLLQELLPRHVEIIQMIDEELIHTIIAGYGTEDLDLLQPKLKQMRILDNIELRASILELLVKSEESTVVDSVEEDEISDEVIESSDEEDQSEGQEEKDTENKVNVTFEPDPKLPKMVHMANLCVVGGHAVNGVAEIHSEIVKEEVFNEFYKFWPEKFQNKTNGVTPRRWICFCNPELSKIINKWMGAGDWVINAEKLVQLQKVKRIHEYKRQLLNITDVGATVNHDHEIGDLLKVVFVPDYNVSVAEVLIPGSELSQHISTAGMEASGTSNMKFAMNGCILIGTSDGANVEIRQEVGENNFFLFGAQAHEIAGLRKERAEGKFVPDPQFEEVKAYVRSGVFGPYNYKELMGSLEGNEGYGRAAYFLVGDDFPSYIECQEKVDEAYRDQKKWTKMSISNTTGSFKFSSDRTIHQYARGIWMIEPVVLP